RERRTARLRQNLGDRRRQRRLAMVNVTNRANVAVRLRTLKLCFRHDSLSSLSFVCRGFRRRISKLLPSSFAKASDDILRCPGGLPSEAAEQRGGAGVKGSDPSSSAWKAVPLPLSYPRLIRLLPSSCSGGGLPPEAARNLRQSSFALRASEDTLRCCAA